MSAQHYYGMYRGIVVSNADPEKRGRLLLQVPQVLGYATTNWALPCWPAGWNRSLMHDHVFTDNDTGDNAGGSTTERLRHKLLLAVPGPRSSVWVMFEGGESTSPVWVGMGTNTQIADALLGSDSTAGGGAAGDGEASGDGSLGPSADSLPPAGEPDLDPPPGGGGGGAVNSVAGRIGDIALTAADIAPGTFPAGVYTFSSGLTLGGYINAGAGFGVRFYNSDYSQNAILTWDASISGTSTSKPLKASALYDGANRVYSASNAPTVAAVTGLQSALDAKASLPPAGAVLIRAVGPDQPDTTGWNVNDLWYDTSTES